MFLGRYTQTVDKDGGILFPEDWRPFFEESRKFYLDIDEEYTCLNLIPEAEIAYAGQGKMRCEMQLGDDWKFRVPEKLRNLIGLKDESVIMGCLRFARIWNPVCFDKFWSEP